MVSVVVGGVAALLADQQNIWQQWQKMSPTVRGQVIDEVAVVRVLRCKTKGRGFDPDSIDLVWK